MHRVDRVIGQDLGEVGRERAQTISDQEGIDGKAIMRRYITLLKEAGHDFPATYPIN